MLLNYNYKVSAIIIRVCYTVIILLRPELIKIVTTENEVKEKADKFLETHGFPQCVGTEQ